MKRIYINKLKFDPCQQEKKLMLYNYRIKLHLSSFNKKNEIKKKHEITK
jgi:hypothetical protein